MGTPLQTLDNLLYLCRSMGDTNLEKEVASRLERLRQGYFYVACLGQFKRGKSTLINALLQCDLLPTGIPPVTSVPTVIKYGPVGGRYLDQAHSWQNFELARIKEFVSEQGNPENKLGIQGLEITLEHPLLQEGLCLVDTPGLSSVFAGNTKETKEFLPQVDAALLVTGADPPLSGDELKLLEELTPEISQILIVINKVDRLTQDELSQARKFTEETLATHFPDFTWRIFEVSAKHALQSNQVPSQKEQAREDNLYDWEELVSYLRDLSNKSRASLLENSGCRAIRITASKIRNRLTLEKEALTTPIEDLTRRLQELQASYEQMQRSNYELSHRFQAHYERLKIQFKRLQQQFIDEATEKLTDSLTKRSRSCTRADAYPILLQTARLKAEELINRWHEVLEPQVETDIQSVTDILLADAAAKLDELHKSGLLPPRLKLPPLDIDASLEERSRYYFHELHLGKEVPFFRRWSDRLKSDKKLIESALSWARNWGIRLLEVNSTRILSDLEVRIKETRRRIEGDLKERIEELLQLQKEVLKKLFHYLE